MDQFTLAHKRTLVFFNIQKIKNKKKYKNRLKHWRKKYKKLTKMIDKIIWDRMSQRLEKSLLEIEENDSIVFLKETLCASE